MKCQKCSETEKLHEIGEVFRYAKANGTSKDGLVYRLINKSNILTVSVLKKVYLFGHIVYR